MTTLKESTIFDNIEKDSIKILTRNVDKYMSIREIHNILHAEHNPNMSEKEDFKYRVHLILSVLPSKLDGIKLNKESPKSVGTLCLISKKDFDIQPLVDSYDRNIDYQRLDFHLEDLRSRFHW